MTNQLEVKIKGITTSKPYTIASIMAHIDEFSSGVYLILESQKVVYVGKAKKLRQRLVDHIVTNTHEALKPFIAHKDLMYQVIYADSTKQRTRLENILYEYYNHPICNIKRPPTWK